MADTTLLSPWENFFGSNKNTVKHHTSHTHNTHTQKEFFETETPRQFVFPQIKLFSFGCDLDISSRLSPPTAHCPAQPATGPSLFLLVGLWCCSNFLVHNPLLHASGTFNSLDRKWYLCMKVSAFKICNFF